MMRALLLAVSGASLLVGCPGKKSPQAEPEPGQSAALPSASTSSAPTAPWYQGKWSGQYDARRQQLDVAPDAGRVRAWDDDDGAQGTGSGKLEITIDAAGFVTGAAQGPLGQLVVSGAVEGDSVRLRLLPPAGSRGPAFAGFVVADRQEGTLKGVFKASSGDSLLVRRATVELAKQDK